MSFSFQTFLQKVLNLRPTLRSGVWFYLSTFRHDALKIWIFHWYLLWGAVEKAFAYRASISFPVEGFSAPPAAAAMVLYKPSRISALDSDVPTAVGSRLETKTYDTSASQRRSFMGPSF